MTQHDPSTSASHSGGPDPLADRYLARDLELHREVVDKLDDLLDLDAGLADILRSARHSDLVEDAGNALDVAAGLADIIASDPGAIPPFAPEHQESNPYDLRTNDERQRLMHDAAVDILDNAAAKASTTYSATPRPMTARAVTGPDSTRHLRTVLETVHAALNRPQAFDDGARLRLRTHREFLRFRETLRLLLTVRAQSDSPFANQMLFSVQNGVNLGETQTWSFSVDVSSSLLDWIESWYPATLIGGVDERTLRAAVRQGNLSALAGPMQQQAETLAEEVLDIPLLFDAAGGLAARFNNTHYRIELSGAVLFDTTSSESARPSRAEVHAEFVAAMRAGMSSMNLAQYEVARRAKVTFDQLDLYLADPRRMPNRWDRIVQLLRAADAPVEQFSRRCGAHWPDHPTVAEPEAEDLDLASTEAFAEALEALTLDFTDADLSGVDLTGVNLEGVQWSSRTLWPADWKTLIEDCSADVGPDLYEVRHGGVLLGAP